LNYNDLALTVTKDFSGVVFGLSAVTVDAKDKNKYQIDNKFTGKSALVLSVKYNF
jgi:Mor family transcriptional regulator